MIDSAVLVVGTVVESVQHRILDDGRKFRLLASGLVQLQGNRAEHVITGALQRPSTAQADHECACVGRIELGPSDGCDHH